MTPFEGNSAPHEQEEVEDVGHKFPIRIQTTIHCKTSFAILRNNDPAISLIIQRLPSFPLCLLAKSQTMNV
jgi:hypothetical protein